MMAKKQSLLSRYDALFLDLDGVIYKGPHAIPHAVKAISSAPVACGYLTNNASRTPESVAEHLTSLGLRVEAHDVVTSPQAAVRVLAELIPANSLVLVVGGEGLIREVENAGFHVTFQADDKPAAVIQGFSPELGWKHLAEASFALQRDETCVWVATNTDWTIPVEKGVAPGNGALVSAVHLAVGRLATFAGKPEKALFDVARERFSSARNPLMVGDRLDTDIAGANKAGIDSAVVLTGIDQAKQILAASPEEQPTYVLGDLRELHKPYPEVHKSVDADGVHTVEVGKAVVRRKDHVVRVARAGDPLDLLRAGSAIIYDSGLKIFGLDVDSQIYSKA